MAAPVHVTKASELHTNTAQTEGMIRKGAIVDLSDRLSGSGMLMFITKVSRLYS